MDTEAFIRWALDDSRTIEERYTVELLVDRGVDWWNSKRKIYRSETIDQLVERSRERELNPAYDPQYSERNLRKAAEFLAVAKQWSFNGQRPIRSVEAIRFLTGLESFTMHFHCEVTDFSPLAELPALRVLKLGYPGSNHTNLLCEDYTFLARCTALRELELSFNAHWPDLTGLDTLTQLETLTLSGNLLALPRGAIYPNVRRGRLHCMPLAARSVADLPQFPACELLTLYGAQRLEGIEKMPALRNLTLLGPFRSFEPLTALTELTWLKVEPTGPPDPARMPRDVAPIARLPKLLYIQIGPPHGSYLDMPRDYSPLAEAPALRELVVKHCPPVEMEVAAIQAGLTPWDDLFLAREARPLPPFRMIVGPDKQQPAAREEHRGPDEHGLIDEGLRDCENRWVSTFATNFIGERVGHRDWGKVEARYFARYIWLTIESFEVVEKLPEILDAARGVMARLRYDYDAHLSIQLRVPPPEPSPAQQELDEQFQKKRDEWEYEQRQRDRAEYLERLHQLELKKQQGEKIDPEKFSPSEQPPYPQREKAAEPDDDDDEDDSIGDGDSGDGGVAVETDPDPPVFDLEEGEHPLADNYRLWCRFTLEAIWFHPRQRGLAVHLMRREPDIDIPEEPEKGE